MLEERRGQFFIFLIIDVVFLKFSGHRLHTVLLIVFVELWVVLHLREIVVLDLF